MNSGIYKITSPNGKIYIGQSIKIKHRFKDYKSYRCKSQRLIYNSLKKYGWENHIFEILVLGRFTTEELNILEIKYIKEYNSFRGLSETGLNLTTGGNVCKKDKTSNFLISESLKKFHAEIGHTKETKEKIANSLKGNISSEETKQKQRESIKKYWDKTGRPYKGFLKNKKDVNALKKQQKEERNLQIIEELKRGIRQDVIAEKYNLSPSAITQLKKKNEIKVETFVRKGQNNNFSKLTEEQVVEIKHLLKDKVKQQTIADTYNVKLRTIKAIQSGQNWNHITIG